MSDNPEKVREKLTHSQRRELDKLANDLSGSGYYGSCTNSTMNALKSRGLVDDQWTDVAGSPYRNHRWVITDAGKSISRSKP